mmetsp:Transcript_10476/g.42272  ORF Transcript_10476/g.42272 Transcript_10476/m.42272 type:complete len:326 (-) Transcript_10476:698-1675(-)
MLPPRRVPHQTLRRLVRQRHGHARDVREPNRGARVDGARSGVDVGAVANHDRDAAPRRERARHHSNPARLVLLPRLLERARVPAQLAPGPELADVPLVGPRPVAGHGGGEVPKRGTRTVIWLRGTRTVVSGVRHQRGAAARANLPREREVIVHPRVRRRRQRRGHRRIFRKLAPARSFRKIPDVPVDDHRRRRPDRDERAELVHPVAVLVHALSEQSRRVPLSLRRRLVLDRALRLGSRLTPLVLVPPLPPFPAALLRALERDGEAEPERLCRGGPAEARRGRRSRVCVWRFERGSERTPNRAPRPRDPAVPLRAALSSRVRVLF